MNEHEVKELKILVESVGWDQFKKWLNDVYCHAVQAELASLELTDIGSVLKERELIGTSKYLKEAINRFEYYVTNAKKEK